MSGLLFGLRTLTICVNDCKANNLAEFVRVDKRGQNRRLERGERGLEFLELTHTLCKPYER